MNADRDEPARNDLDAKPADGVEIWARRLGRVLGWSAAAFMLIYLLRTYAS
jgi:hypothetical protein